MMVVSAFLLVYPEQEPPPQPHPLPKVEMNEQIEEEDIPTLTPMMKDILTTVFILGSLKTFLDQSLTIQTLERKESDITKRKEEVIRSFQKFQSCYAKDKIPKAPTLKTDILQKVKDSARNIEEEKR